jgi:hypothetical protein
MMLEEALQQLSAKGASIEGYLQVGVRDLQRSDDAVKIVLGYLLDEVLLATINGKLDKPTRGRPIRANPPKNLLDTVNKIREIHPQAFYREILQGLEAGVILLTEEEKLCELIYNTFKALAKDALQHGMAKPYQCLGFDRLRKNAKVVEELGTCLVQFGSSEKGLTKDGVLRIAEKFAPLKSGRVHLQNPYKRAYYRAIVDAVEDSWSSSSR